MAKRKRKRGGGSKLQIQKDYRDDQYVPYIHKAETGIIEVWRAEPDLTDGEVRQALRDLIALIGNWDKPPTEPAILDDEPSLVFAGDSKVDQLSEAIIDGLQIAFAEQGPLTIEDLIGVLKQINYSVGNMNTGLKQQGYLRFVADFLGFIRQ